MSQDLLLTILPFRKNEITFLKWYLLRRSIGGCVASSTAVEIDRIKPSLKRPLLPGLVQKNLRLLHARNARLDNLPENLFHRLQSHENG
jgi:hypothetical protein